MSKDLLDISARDLGLREIVGAHDNPRIVEMFRDVGHDEIDNDETAWCAAAVGSWLERSGRPSTGKLNARSYMAYGSKVGSLDAAEPGDIVVLWRVSPKSWQGHVALYIRHDDKTVTLRGGNQANMVNETKYDRSKVIAIRRPPPVEEARDDEKDGLAPRVTVEMVRKIAPRGRADLVAALPALVNKYAPTVGINTPVRLAAFLANIMTETGGLTDFEENLSYTAKRIVQVWPKRFKNEKEAAPYARNPEKLANRVYDRFGNKGIPGAGWKYRGRGWLQTTFIDNYRKVEDATGLDVVANPDILTQPEAAMKAAVLYWNYRNGNSAADSGDISQMRKAVNGGTIGLQTFEKYLRMILPMVQGVGYTPNPTLPTTIGTGGGAVIAMESNIWWGLAWFGLVVAGTVGFILFKKWKGKRNAKKLLAKLEGLPHGTN